MLWAGNRSAMKYGGFFPSKNRTAPLHIGIIAEVVASRSGTIEIV